jgi:FMN phosphatase YigB (HAD superfamily)
MIVGFDYDGTLVTSWTAEPLPGVPERLAQLPSGAKTFIATNQAGPVFRAVLGEMKYPAVEDVAQRIADGLTALDWRPTWLLVAVHPGNDGTAWTEAAITVRDALSSQLYQAASIDVAVSAHPGWRKPQAGMLGQVAYWCNITPERLVYIGDTDTDAQAAATVGARYLDAADWLAGTEP